ncbi:hypothetical protein PoB_006970600 [Plakobranchus ocellatus]|uniref:Uncharacterized protein n=1 Tax=Plakobranchus ocellatus TaxID=259542 RepID=A0AAV4DH75_9GAST|nr:hypothetical protein PoB_006970600 [Plakobranchus ocellatus]
MERTQGRYILKDKQQEKERDEEEKRIRVIDINTLAPFDGTIIFLPVLKNIDGTLINQLALKSIEIFVLRVRVNHRRPPCDGKNVPKSSNSRRASKPEVLCLYHNLVP